jgi:hypothetical protein
LLEGSDVSSVPAGLMTDPKPGIEERFKEELPGDAFTVADGDREAPSAPQPELIVMSAVFTLKNILPTAFTMSLPLLVTILGTVIVCVPSLGVLDNKT